VSVQVEDDNKSLIQRHAALIVWLFALSASITGIFNGFAFDDRAIIVEDARFRSLHTLWQVFTHTYWSPQYGGSLYRPLTTLGFALQWMIGHGSPLPFHVVSILLYAAVSVAVFGLAKQLLDDTSAFVGAALFAVHPVHVEAVANVVGQSELGAAFFVITAMSLYVRWSRSGGIGARQILILSALFLCGLMFKEHAVVLPGLIVAGEILTLGSSETFNARARRLSRLLIPLAVVAAAFVVARTVIVGTVGEALQASALLHQPFRVRALTMLPVVLEWVRLFVWPASLSADYSPPRIDVMESFTIAMVPAIAVVIATAGIAVQLRKQHPSTTFALAWLGITLLIPSNLIVVTGVTLAERMLFLPSVGATILLGAALVALARNASPSLRRGLVYPVGLVIISGIVRSSTRNPVWRNDETLFRQTADDVPNSSKAHEMLGDVLMSKGNREGIIEMQIGVKLSSPTDAIARHYAARRFYRSGMRQAALPLYKEALALDPSSAQIRQEEAYCLAQLGQLDEGIAVAKEGLRRTPGDQGLTQFLAFAAKVKNPATSPVVASN
jgi:protein O-mannosyl-transferase